ncbi:MAG TPA: hypothetical protein VM658_00300 [bacterium]|nr:hypothetical protein [bacterium]
MVKKAAFVFRGDRGMSTIWIVMIVAVLAVGIFIAAKFGPIHMAKWDLEDYMEQSMRGLYSTGEDGMYEGLNLYVKRNNLPLSPDENCILEGEIGQPGRLTCSYDYKIVLPGYTYIYHVVAEARVGKIPTTFQ